MEGIAAEVSQKLKSAIKAKLMELGAYVDDELSNYVMVMVTNRRSKAEMDRELQLFLGANTSAFTSWLQSVWMKLEQVTVTNSGIETSRKKAAEKKKKTKKLSKSSSESEDEKKHKKKRKSSSSDTTIKDSKKRKLVPKASNDSTKTDSGTDTKKTKKDELRLNMESDSEDDERVENFASKKTIKDIGGGGTIDEDDFLNIKEDFESEFLSDNELSESSRSKAPSIEEFSKKVAAQKVDAETTVLTAVDVPSKRSKEGGSIFAKAIENAKVAAADRVKAAAAVTVSKSHASDAPEEADDRVLDVPAKVSGTRKPLIRDRKLRSPPKSKPRRHSPTPPSRSPSRSRSVSQTKAEPSRRQASESISPVRGDADEDFNAKIQRSRLKSAAISGGSVVVKAASRSRSRSPLRSAAAKKLKSREKSPTVVDARELINRKRAMCQANDHTSNAEDRGPPRRLLSTKMNVEGNAPVDDVVSSRQKGDLGTAKTTVSGGKIIRLRDREQSKENCITGDDNAEDNANDDGWAECGGGDNPANVAKIARRNADGKYGRFVVSKSDGKRSVIVQPTAKSPPPGNRKIDLRGIKRTVYIDGEVGDGKNEADTVTENDIQCHTDVKDDKGKVRKSVVNQIVKYIREDPTVSSTVVKLPKPTRPKTTVAQSASSTLIRKAMADAHKSLTTSKEESLKKKETVECKSGIVSKDKTFDGKNEASFELQISDDEEELTEQKEVEMDDEERLSPKSFKSEDDRIDDVSGEDDKITLQYSNNINEAEEYDPSLNMPQFVVTLTGLDSKIYPQLETEELNENFSDEYMDTAIFEDTKVKPKLQERCKYYPNCLAGDQCLYYHPTIPCKLFPNCKYGNNCLYVHPKCKFDSLCTRYDCTFLHTTTSRIAAPVSARHAPAPTIMNGQPCKFYYNCVNPICPFQHPKICRFDRFCTNKNCTFSHTSLSHVSTVSKDKLKWSRPKENDIKMDAGEPKYEYDVMSEIQ